MDRRSFLSKAYDRTRGSLKLLGVLLAVLIVYALMNSTSTTPGSFIQSIGNLLNGFAKLLAWIASEWWKVLLIGAAVIMLVWGIRLCSRNHPSVLTANNARIIELVITYTFFLAVMLFISHKFYLKGNITGMVFLAGLGTWLLIKSPQDQKQV